MLVSTAANFQILACPSFQKTGKPCLAWSKEWHFVQQANESLPAAQWKIFCQPQKLHFWANTIKWLFRKHPEKYVLNQGGPKLGLAAIFSVSVHKHTNNVTFTKPWGHQTRCGHSQSAYWPFHLQKDESPKPNRLLRTSVSQPSLCESNGDESQQSSQTMANVKAINWGVCLDDNRLEDDKKSIQRGLRQTRCTQRREGSEEIRLRAHKPVFAQIGTDKRASIHAWVWPVKVNTPSNLISRYRRRKVLCHGSLLSPMWSLVHQCKSEP